MQTYERVFEATPDALLVVDHHGMVRRVNAAAERMFGYPRETFAGLAIERLIPDRLAQRHAAHRAGYVAAPHSRPMGAGLELFARRNDGTEFPVDVMLSPMDTSDGPVVLCVARDITERKRAERVLDALREKEVLLKEVHHRVKNNLAVISSLFYLQSTYTRDEGTIRILQESQERVRSMALVHESLYRSENLAEVDFADYARVLAERLVRSYQAPDRPVTLEVDAHSLSLGVDTAIPCGLVLNELMTNALLHAFPPGRGGTVHVALMVTADGHAVLDVTDDGVGPPPGLDLDGATSLGLRLVRLLTGQLDGRFTLLDANPGCRARLTFPVAP